MIFVTVGTHEQPFDRLIQKVDELKGKGIITDEVMMQIGYTEYKPEHCKYEKLLPYTEMESSITKARIVITHGGPASFLMPLQYGKIPIVVPRQSCYGEHVNDHQIEFVNALVERSVSILPLFNIEDLAGLLKHYESMISLMRPEETKNNTTFNTKFAEIVAGIMALK